MRQALVTGILARARREVWRAREGAMLTRDRVHRNISCSCPPGSMAGARRGNADARQLASCAAVSTRFLVINRFYYGETIHVMRNVLHLRQAAIQQEEVFK